MISYPRPEKGLREPPQNLGRGQNAEAVLNGVYHVFYTFPNVKYFPFHRHTRDVWTLMSYFLTKFRNKAKADVRRYMVQACNPAREC